MLPVLLLFVSVCVTASEIERLVLYAVLNRKVHFYFFEPFVGIRRNSITAKAE